MAILPIHTFPDPVLKTRGLSVERLDPIIRQLVDDLIDTMRRHTRCVGLAAPQVGRNLRVAVMDVTAHPKAKRTSGLIVLINPQITARQGAAIQREGCLSIPDFTANVRRAARVQVSAQDASGKTWTRWFDDFEAIVVQHELDHLDGTLFLDRVVNLKTDVFRRKDYG